MVLLYTARRICDRHVLGQNEWVWSWLIDSLFYQEATDAPPHPSFWEVHKWAHVLLVPKSRTGTKILLCREDTHRPLLIIVSELVGIRTHSTTKGYIRAENNVPFVSYLLCIQVIQPQIIIKNTKLVPTQIYKKHTNIKHKIFEELVLLIMLIIKNYIDKDNNDKVKFFMLHN